MTKFHGMIFFDATETEFQAAKTSGTECVFVICGILRRSGHAYNGVYYWTNGGKFYKSQYAKEI